MIGVDIAEDMIEKAQEADPDGDYRRIRDGDFSGIGKATRDLVLSAFTFDNIPTLERKVGIFRGMAELLTAYASAHQGPSIGNAHDVPLDYVHRLLRIPE